MSQNDGFGSCDDCRVEGPPLLQRVTVVFCLDGRFRILCDDHLRIRGGGVDVTAFTYSPTVGRQGEGIA